MQNLDEERRPSEDSEAPPPADPEVSLPPVDPLPPPPADPGPPPAAETTAPAGRHNLFTRLNTWLRDRRRQMFSRRKCPYCLATIVAGSYRELNQHRIPVCANPECQHDLPADFFRNHSHVITLIGGPDTSKSTFITVLIDQVQQSHALLKLGDLHGGLIDLKSRKAFDKQHTRLYTSKKRLETTRPPHQVEKTPMVMRLQHRRGRRTMSTFISLFDIPGEAFESADRLTREYPHLSNADAMIYLIDPLNLRQLLQEIMLAGDDEWEVEKINFNTDYNLLDMLKEIFERRSRTDKRGKVTIPIAFCLSKTDLLDKIATFYTPEELDTDLLTLQDIRYDLDYTSREMREYIQDADPRLFSQITGNFVRPGFFPVAPLGKNPNEASDDISNGPEPRGLLHPLLWLLLQLKFIR